MKAWIIYNEQDAKANQSFIEWFIKEAAIEDIQLSLVYQHDIRFSITRDIPDIKLQEQSAEPPDFIISRTRESIIRKQFEMIGVRVFNNSDIGLICNHKGLTYMAINQLSIPITDTMLINNHTMPPKEAPFNFPFVVKAANGHGGTEVFFIKNIADWKQFSESSVRQDYIIQSADQILPGIDIRVFVVGKEIIAAVKRTNKHDFRANFKLGGTAEIFTLTEEMKTTVHKIINSFDFGMAGIDFLLTADNNLVFNEIEDVAGSRILSATTDINIVRLYLQHIKKTL